MIEAELRAKIRDLMASGELPREAPSIERRGVEESARFALQPWSRAESAASLARRWRTSSPAA